MIKSFYTSEFVKQSLQAHSWFGLMIGAFMYLICLSGTLAVFYEEFERWEQPYAEEYRDYDVRVIEETYKKFVQTHTEETGHIHIVFPVPGKPRVIIENDHNAWFVNKDGSLGEQELPLWTKMLIHLHLYLHLPQTAGLIVVSACGVILLTLILSGLLAHPRIFKDAFSLRLGGNKHLEQADIHNRLSVWGAPFHIMIAITGAYFGLAAFIAFTIAAMFYNGDPMPVWEKVFGEEPVLNQERELVEIAKSVEQLKDIAPGTSPIFMTIHEPGTSGQFLEVYSDYPDRLIYSDNHLFDASGNYLGNEGFSDGELGKQVVYSTYRLHFGHFGGFGVKLLYLILGLSLTVVSVTGVNIWLAKRKNRDCVNDCWAGFVWGAPLALTMSAFAQVIFSIDSTVTFWLVILSTCFYALLKKNERTSALNLQLTLAASMLCLVIGYSLKFSQHALSAAAVSVNSCLLATAIFFFIMVWKQRQTTHSSPSLESKMI